MDQVLPPFVIVLDYTWDTRGIRGPVCFPPPGADSGEQKCNIKLCFCHCGIQPNITVIFWEQGGILYILINKHKSIP